MSSKYNRTRFVLMITLAGGILLLVGLYLWVKGIAVGSAPEFTGERALQDVKYQVSLGPRVPGSSAHFQVQKWILDELGNAGWSAEIQEAQLLGKPIYNIVAKRGVGKKPWIILGAHYDTRITAERDPDPTKRGMPGSGANDGASGVAVLLELARSLPLDLEGEIWLVFFDAEDNGNIPGWEWIMGSTAFVEGLSAHPDAAVIVDMVGDADLNLYYERNSTPSIAEDIWKKASDLGYGEQFIPELKYAITDDHVPFLLAGIPAVDIIDIDYPYWHTASDTPDKISAASLNAVGDTLRGWMIDLIPLAK